jgi:signal transduction histidine kinase
MPAKVSAQRRDLLHPLRTYVIIATIAILPLAAFLFLAHRLLYRQAIARLVEQSSVSGKLYGTLIDRRFDETSILLQSFALRTDVLQDWQGIRFERIDTALEQLHRLRPDILSFEIRDLEGTLRASYPAALKGGVDFVARDGQQAGQRRTKPYVSPVYAADGTLSVLVAVPILDARGQPTATLSARQTLASVAAALYGLVSPQNAKLIYVVDQKGQIFGSRAGAIADLSSQLAGYSHDSIGHITSAGGRSYIASFSTIPVSQWGILIEIPVSTVQAALWDYERGLAFLGLGIIALGVLGGFMIARLHHRVQRAESGYRRELEEKNEALEAFSYSVSHDLRAPLRAISGYASILAEDYAGNLDETARDYLGHIGASVKTMDALVHDLLEYSRVARVKFEPEAVSLRTVIGEAQRQLETDIKGSAAEIEVPAEVPVVLGNRALLTQTITNLLSNAMKFVPPGKQPKIQISIVQENGWVRVTVRDNGIGIPAEHREKIFRPFERLHPTDRYPGSGVGLAIVSKAMERMHGNFGYESQVNAGSEFWIELPAAGEKRAADLQNPPGQLTRSGSAASWAHA